MIRCVDAQRHGLFSCRHCVFTAVLLKQGTCQAAIAAAVVRIQLDRFAIRFFGLRPHLAAIEEAGKHGSATIVFRVELNRAAEALFGLRILAADAQYGAQIALGHRVFRAQANRFTKGCFCLIQFLLMIEGRAEASVKKRPAGIQRHTASR